MRPLTSCLTVAALLVAATGSAFAQDNSALIDMLARKGIISDQEAEDLRADLSKENSAATVSTAKGSFLDKVTITGRIQAHYVGLSTDIDGTDSDPAATNHFFLRRVRLGARAQFFDGFSGYINYDFASTSFDAVTVTWKQSDTLSFDLGLRKAPLGYEEFIVSSASIRPIERSGVTRYFVESNNGRRLGAGKYRQGVWLVGGNAKQGFSYQLAVTNPEGVSTAGESAGTGNASNNTLAYWGHAAYTGLFTNGTYKVGGSLGFMPDQGGRTPATTGSVQYDLTVANVFGDVTIKSFSLAGEYYQAKVEGGRGTTASVEPWGFYLQPSYRLSSAYELVARYGYVDSDGRGISLSDSVRSAPSGGTMNDLTEIYLGGNWYIRGNDVKLSLGYVWGRTEDTVAGAPAEATTQGARSQFQVNF